MTREEYYNINRCCEHRVVPILGSCNLNRNNPINFSFIMNKIIEIGNGVVDISKVTAVTPIYYDEIEIKIKKNKSSKPMQLGIKPKLRKLYYFSICMGHHWIKITPLKNQFDTYSGGRYFCEQEHRKFIKTFQDWHKKDNE